MIKEMWRLPATQMVRDENKRLKGLFRQLESLTGAEPERNPGFRDEVRLAVLIEVEAWSAMEAGAFYPAIARHPALARDSAVQALLDSGFRFHRELADRLREFRSMLEQQDAALDFDFEELTRDVETHLAGDDDAILAVTDRVLGNWTTSLTGPLRAAYAAVLSKPENAGKVERVFRESQAL